MDMKEKVLNFLGAFLLAIFISALISGGISKMCQEKYYSCLGDCELRLSSSEDGFLSSYCSEKCEKTSIYYEDYQTCYDTCKDLLCESRKEKCKRDLEADQGLLRLFTIFLVIYLTYTFLKR